MKIHKIVIHTHKVGREEKTVIQEGCPFNRTNNICILECVVCKYGLTEVKVPLPVCPLKMGVTQTITIKEENIKD